MLIKQFFFFKVMEMCLKFSFFGLIKVLYSCVYLDGSRMLIHIIWPLSPLSLLSSSILERSHQSLYHYLPTGRHGFEGNGVWYCRGGEWSIFTRGLWDICDQSGQRKYCGWKIEVDTDIECFSDNDFWNDYTLIVLSWPAVPLSIGWMIGCWR